MKAVFIDRDGTLIYETPSERITTVRELELLPGTIEALKLLKQTVNAVNQNQR